jgi:tetratricopeptide (TPR) repeat protein
MNNPQLLEKESTIELAQILLIQGRLALYEKDSKNAFRYLQKSLTIVNSCLGSNSTFLIEI